MSAATLERTSHRKPSKKVRQRRKTGERLLHWFTWA